MSNTTKRALEASLKKLLLQKPLDKITIQDLTTDCGISRMAFYYHFKDIYDLVEWACVEDGKRALQGKRTYNSWQEGLEQIFKAVLENKPFIMNVYRSVSKEQIESYLYKLTFELIEGVVNEKAEGTGLPEEDKRFIADFYKNGFYLTWLKFYNNLYQKGSLDPDSQTQGYDGMQEDYSTIVKKMSLTLHGNISNSIGNFLDEG